MSSTTSRRTEFLIGWIAAIDIEYTAARHVLDVIYPDEDIFLAHDDSTGYTIGCIGTHNVVVATLPPDTYGTHPALRTANGLKEKFPSIRVILMVGIAGGAPSAHHDVRLGDVVVGTRVVPYNEVKLTDEGRIFNGDIVISDKGPLQHARKVTGRIVDGLLDIDDRISQHFSDHKSERIRDMFERPEDQPDRLYEAHYRHTNTCDCMLKNPQAVDRLVVRPQRKAYDRIKVHFGKIGSAAILVRTAEERDIESQKHNLLCFEMESAGLVGMDKFFCLPIRGICDYADSHKNKHWQPYAAASAAIFAKSLLESLQPSVIMRLQPALDPDGVHNYVQSVVNDVNRVTNERMDRLGLDYDKVDRSVQDLNAHVVWLLRMSTGYSGDLADLKSTNNHNNDAIGNARGRLQEVEKDQKKMGEALQKMESHIKDLQSTSISKEEKQKLEGLHRHVQSHASQLESLRATTHHSLSLATYILEKVGLNTQNRKVMIASDILGNHGSITDRDGYWGQWVSRDSKRSNIPGEGPSKAPSESTTSGSRREEMQSKQHTSKLEGLKSKVLRQKLSKKNEGRDPEREIQPRNYNHAPVDLPVSLTTMQQPITSCQNTRSPRFEHRPDHRSAARAAEEERYRQRADRAAMVPATAMRETSSIKSNLFSDYYEQNNRALPKESRNVPNRKDTNSTSSSAASDAGMSRGASSLSDLSPRRLRPVDSDSSKRPRDVVDREVGEPDPSRFSFKTNRAFFERYSRSNASSQSSRRPSIPSSGTSR